VEVFRISKLLRMSPLRVYELEDLRGELIDGQFYGQELTPIEITRRTESLADKVRTPASDAAFASISSRADDTAPP
jgi:hypothetical protein